MGEGDGARPGENDWRLNETEQRTVVWFVLVQRWKQGRPV